MVRSSAILPKEVLSQESRLFFEFKSRGRKRVNLESSGGVGWKVKLQVNLSFFPKPNVDYFSIILPKGILSRESSLSVEFGSKG